MPSAVTTRSRSGQRGQRALTRVVGAALALGALLVSQVAVAPAYAVAPTGAPVLTSPANDTQVSENPVLSWDAVTGAARYRVQISASGSFSPVIWTSDTVNTHSTPPTELPTGSLFWRVAATDGASGIGPWSQLGAFTKVAGGAPTGLQPADAATFAYPAESPVLQWSPLPGVKTYKVEIDDETSFINAPVVATTANTAYAVSYQLTLDKVYYWRVSGTTVANAPTATSDPRSFTVTWPANVGRPVLTSPANTTSTSISDVVLRWAPVDGAQRYLLQVSPNPDFTNNFVENNTPVFGTQYSPDNTYNNGDYYWRVRAVDTNGRLGPWSWDASFLPTPPRIFNRASAAPATPNLVYPLDGATVDEFRFGWSPVPTAGQYEMQYAADASFVTGIKACTTFHTTFTGYSRPTQTPSTPTYPESPGAPATLGCTSPVAGATYFWRVRGIDTDNGSAVGQVGPWSATRSMTFALPVALPGTVAPLETTDYLAPANCEAPACTDSMPDTPELSWNAVPGATNYLVHIANDKAFTNEIQRYQVGATHLTPRESLPDNATNGAYYWWVQPCGGTVAAPTGCAAADPSNARAFRKLASAVQVSTPANGATVDDVVAFSWQDPWATQPDATGVGYYRIQISGDPAFNTTIDEATVDQTTYESVGETYPDGQYYWHVQAVDASGLQLSWSATRSFTKVSARPSGLVSTRLDASSALPVLSWASTPYVSGYIVEIYAGSDPLFPSGSRKANVTVKLAAYTPIDALPQGTYSWRVRRLDASGNPGPWQVFDDSAALPTFIVAAPVPELLTPTHASVFGGNTILMSWTPVKGAAQYRLESSVNAGFTSNQEVQVTVMTAWAPASSYPDSVPIYWRVKALDSASQVIATSAVRTFTKDSKAPTAVFGTTAATNSLRPTVSVTFSESVTGVSPSSIVMRRAGTTVIASNLVCTDASTAVVPCSGSTVRKVAATAAANVIPGETYSVSTTSAIVDPLGNVLAAGSVSFRALLTVQQNSGSPVLSAGWTTVSAAAAAGGSYARTGTKGASVSWVFKGSSVRVLWLAYKNYGKIGIYVDGVLKLTVDQYGGGLSTKYSTVSSLSNGLHTVKVVALGTKGIKSTGTYASVDAFSTT
jgi:hypothetical protein